MNHGPDHRLIRGKGDLAIAFAPLGMIMERIDLCKEPITGDAVQMHRYARRPNLNLGRCVEKL
jgi:hypothetical protein